MAKQENATSQTGGAKGQVREGHRIGDGVRHENSYQPTRDVVTPPPSRIPSTNTSTPKK
jgi:hypothetical protein